MLLSYLALVVSLVVSSVQAACKTQFFKQKVWHESTYHDDSTFEQQFEAISDYYKQGGPILFYQGAESGEFSCIEAFVMTDWAKELGAYLLSIEHRFFGKSIPSNDSNVIEKYKSLTLDNVMADSVALISHIKSTTPGLESAKVIVHGGRYSSCCSEGIY